MTGRAHSAFGGSTAARWLACPGSVGLCALAPEKPSSKYAAEGSAAHKLAEDCLKENLHPTHFLDEVIEIDGQGFTVTQEMCDAVVVYLNAVEHELAQTKDGELYVEQGFELVLKAAEAGEVFGTNDALVYHPTTGRLRVFDYKHGVGVSVSIEENAQLKFYAAGAVFSHPEWKVKEVILTIVQPRALDADEAGAVKDWRFEPVELLEFVGDLNDGVAAAKQPGAPFASGPHCRWCEAAPFCVLRENEILEKAKLDFAGITDIRAADLPEPKTLDIERLGAVLVAGDLLSGWINQVRDYVEALVLSGQKVPGWKAVEKIGRAKWIGDEEQITGYLAMLYDLDEEAIRPRKLTTITEVEKLLKAAGADKAAIDAFKMKFCLKESSGLTLAPESDRRPAVNAVAADFDGVKPVTA